MNIKKIFFYFLILLSFKNGAQNKILDSLKFALKNSLHDTSKVKILLELGNKNYSTKPDTAIKYWEMVKNISEKNRDNFLKSNKEYKSYSLTLARCYSNMGAYYKTNGKNDMAFGYYEKSLVLSKELSSNKILANTLANISLLYFSLGDNAKAIDYCNQSLKIFELIKDEIGLINAYYNLSNIYSRQGDILKAMNYLEKSLEFGEKLNDNQKISRALNGIGLIYKDQGNFEKSLNYLDRSLKIREKIKDKNGIAESLNNIGLLYSSQKDFVKTLEYYKESLKIFEEVGNKLGMAQSINNIGTIYFQIGDPTIISSKKESFKMGMIKSLEYFKESLKIREQISDKKGIAQSLSNIGGVYYGFIDQNEKFITEDSLKNCLLKSMEFYNKSLKIREELSDKEGVIYSTYNIGMIFYLQKKYNEAIQNCTKAMNMAKELGYPKQLKIISEGLTKIYKAIGNNELALEYYETHIRMRDSLNNIETQKALIIQQTRYEFEKQQALAKADFEKQQVLINLELQKKQNLIEKNNQQLLILEKDNKLQQLSLVQNAIELEQKQIIADNQKKKLELLNKEQKLIKIESEKRETNLKQQKLLNTALVIGVVLITLILLITIKGFIQKKKDNIIINQQKNEVDVQRRYLVEKNQIIEEKQKEILDSITYARRLQEAILPPEKIINENLTSNFIFYKPKDIVAGDFYWAELVDNKFFIAAADSTGHGVPGAMVSVVCSNALNRSVNEFNITETGKILDKTRELVLETFSKGNSEVKDGMDISLLCIDKEKNKIFWSGANNPLWYIQDEEFKEIKANKQPIGYAEQIKQFTTHEIEYKKNTLFYLFTDGFADQFGGPRGKKFKYKQLIEILFSSKHLNMQEQCLLVEKSFFDWKGEMEQVDDVCVLGIRI